MGFDGCIGQASLDDFIERKTMDTEKKKASNNTLQG